MDNSELNIYREDETINVKLRVKDYRILQKIIERERSLGVVFKYLLTILGGIITISAAIKTGFFERWVN